MTSPLPRPYPLGPLPAAGVDILAIVAAAPLLHQTRYQVRYHCCGAVGETPHSQIRRRLASRRPQCQHCRYRRERAYPLGHLPAAGVDILALRHTGTTLRDTLYEIRYHCCGRVATLSDISLASRISRQIVRCSACALAAANDARRLADRQDPPPAAGDGRQDRDDAMGLVGRYWPRPASLAGQAPLVWGVQP